MSVLRIFLTGDGACDWTLQDDGDAGDAAGRHGENTHYAELPRAVRCVAVVPAARMRTLTVSVPPTTTAKLPAVVRFALEDQLAGDVEAQHVVIAGQLEREAIVHVIDRGWLKTALADLARSGTRPVVVVAESDLAPRAPDARAATWVWREDGGFLIEAGGRVTVLDQSRDALPSGLLLVLRKNGGGHALVARVVVHGPSVLTGRCDAWSRATGARFDVEAEWSWRDARAGQLAAAANLFTPDLHADTASSTGARHRPSALRRALWWLLAAVLLHAGASAAEWGMLKWRVVQVERDTQRLIRGAALDLAGDLELAWRRHYAAARHRQGKIAPDDALPLLADAAAALPDLPPGALRMISFESGQLTLEFERSAAAAIAAALPIWKGQQLSVLQAELPGSLRIRLARQ